MRENFINNFRYYLFIGINIFLDGFVPTENLRFRETSLTFKVAETADKVFLPFIVVNIALIHLMLLFNVLNCSFKFLGGRN